MRGTGACLTTIAGLLLVAIPGAHAQTPGLTVDPSSPGGKEYAIPLDQARGQASGDPSGVAAQAPTGSPAATTPGPLFGEGVDAPDSAPADPSGQGAGAKPTQDNARSSSGS